MKTMLFSIAVTLLFLSFFASVVLTGYLRNIARANNLLIDIPDKSRKFHFRPTPLIGGISIHASILLSSLFMLFLIDYKYDFQFEGLSLSKQSELQAPSQTSYSKKLSIKTEDGNNLENFRLNILPQSTLDVDSPSYDVNFGSNSNDSLNITKVNENVFNVTLPNGEVKTFQATNAGIVELGSSGEKIGKPFIIQNNANEFFSFSAFSAAFLVIALMLQAFILLDDAFGMSASKRIVIQFAAALSLILVGDIYIDD